MNCILYEDESSIESISDGDLVIIIEDIYYLDDTYYNFLNNRNYIGDKTNVSLRNIKGKINMIVPSDTKLSQLYKALILKFGCDYYFLSDGRKISDRDER